MSDEVNAKLEAITDKSMDELIAEADEHLAITGTQAKSGKAAEPTPEGQEGEQEEGETSEGKAEEATAEEIDLDPMLRQTARRAKLSDDAVRRLGDMAVPVLTALKAQQDQVSAILGRMGQQEQPTQAKEQPKKPEKTDEQHTFNPSVYGEDAEVFDAMQHRIDELAQTVNELRSSPPQDSENVNKLVADADDVFSEVAATMESKYGKGSLVDMDENSPQAQERIKVLRFADTLRKNSGQTYSRKEAIELAISALNPNYFEDKATAEVARKAADRKKGQVRKPTGQKPTKPEKETPEEAARRAAAEVGVEMA